MHATLRAVKFGQRSANDLDVNIPDTEADRLLADETIKVLAEISSGIFTWPTVRYSVLEVGGTGFAVRDIESTDKKRLVISIGERVSEGTAFIP